MNKIFYGFSICLLALTQPVQADVVPGDVTFENVQCTRENGKIFLSMDVDLKKLKLKREEELVFTPVVYEKDQSHEFPEFRVTGRYRYYRHLRNRDSVDVRTLYRYGKNDIIHYEASAPYKDWMAQSRIAVLDNRCGCPCRVENAPRTNDLTQVDLADRIFAPDYYFIEPCEKEVERAASGSAFVDFVVNRTEIREDYRNNIRELGKITSTIDTIKSDPDVQITALTVKGYASPEGSYAGNARLAQGRTEALKKYLQNKYNFPAGLMKAESEPEDWEGFERMVRESNLDHRDEILALIGRTDLQPDAKDHRIRAEYPQDYQYILAHIYPALRHSDYTVSYKVRNYTDIDEAKRVMKTKPGHLSEHEFYMVAQTYKPGSEEFCEAFDIMVRVYPSEVTANLNAANASMQRGDFKNAAKFLDRVGRTPAADYARGNLACLVENAKYSEDRDYTTAIRYFEEVSHSSDAVLSRKASEALQRIAEMQRKRSIP